MKEGEPLLGNGHNAKCFSLCANQKITEVSLSSITSEVSVAVSISTAKIARRCVLGRSVHVGGNDIYAKYIDSFKYEKMTNFT